MSKKNPSLSVGRGEKLPASKGAGLTQKVETSTTQKQAAISKHLNHKVGQGKIRSVLG